jgi:flagellar protein FliO/FliZ
LKYVKKLTLLLMSLLLIFIAPVGAWADQQDSNVFEDFDQNKNEGGASNDGVSHDEPKVDPAVLAQQEDISLVTTFIKMILALVLIIGLIYMLVRFLSRSRAIGLNGPFRLIGGVHLAPNKSIQMIKVGNEIYIVGVGEDVNLLRRIDDPEERDQILESVESRNSFQASEWKTIRSWMGRFLQKKTVDEGTSFQSMLSERLNSYRKRSKTEGPWNASQEEDQEGKSL